MRWYSAYCFEVTVHQLLIASLLYKDCSDITSFQANSPYSFHQTISSTPNLDGGFFSLKIVHTRLHFRSTPSLG